jgi:hypothetical protein
MTFTVCDQGRTTELYSSERRWPAPNLAHDLPANAKRFFRAEVLNRWTDLSPEDVSTLNADRDALICFLQQRYGFARRRAASEADSFIARLQNTVRSATEMSGFKNPEINAA